MTRRRVLWPYPVAALALGLLAGGGTVALWSESESVVPVIQSGYANFAVGDPGAVAPTDGSTWSLPADLLGDGTAGNPYLAAGETALAVVQLDGTSQGNRGLSWNLPAGAVTVTGGELAEGLTTTVVAVADPAGCTPAAIAAGPVLYTGPIAGITLAPTTLVTADYSTATVADPETAYRCFAFTVPAWSGSYANTGSVSAQNGGITATDTDTWNANLLPPASAYVVDVTIEFDFETFRPGAAP